MKGVLGSFGRAFLLRSNDNSCFLFREDLRQFLILMETVVGYYKTEGTNQQTEVNIPEKINKQTKLSYFQNYRFLSFLLQWNRAIRPPHGGRLKRSSAVCNWENYSPVIGRGQAYLPLNLNFLPAGK